MEEEKREHDSKMKKMEAEMEQVFEMKVKEKKQKLKDSELELTRRHDERKKVRLEKFFDYFERLTQRTFILGTWATNPWARRASQGIRDGEDWLGTAQRCDSRRDAEKKPRSQQQRVSLTFQLLTTFHPLFLSLLINWLQLTWHSIQN